MFEKGYKPTKDEIESAENMMGKEEKKMSRDREVDYREPIESLEEFDEEYKKIDDFIESLKEQFPEGFQPFKAGFWPKLMEIVKKLEKEKVVPYLLKNEEISHHDELLIEEKNEKLYKQTICGGSKISGGGIFIARFWAHYIIDQIKEKKLTDADELEKIKNAFPHWSMEPFLRLDNLQYALHNVDCRRSTEALRKVLERELDSLESIKNSSNRKEIDEVLKIIHNKIQTLLSSDMEMTQERDRSEVFKKASDQKIDLDAVLEFLDIPFSSPTLVNELVHERNAMIHFKGIDEMIAMCKKEIESLDKLDKK